MYDLIFSTARKASSNQLVIDFRKHYKKLLEIEIIWKALFKNLYNYLIF